MYGTITKVDLPIVQRRKLEDWSISHDAVAESDLECSNRSQSDLTKVQPILPTPTRPPRRKPSLIWTEDNLTGFLYSSRITRLRLDLVHVHALVPVPALVRPFDVAPLPFDALVVVEVDRPSPVVVAVREPEEDLYRDQEVVVEVAVVPPFDDQRQ